MSVWVSSPPSPHPSRLFLGTRRPWPLLAAASSSACCRDICCLPADRSRAERGLQRAAADSALSPGQLCTATPPVQKCGRNPGNPARDPMASWHCQASCSVFRLEEQKSSVIVNGFKVLKLLSRDSTVECLTTVLQVPGSSPTLLSPKQQEQNPK